MNRMRKLQITLLISLNALCLAAPAAEKNLCNSNSDCPVCRHELKQGDENNVTKSNTIKSNDRVKAPKGNPDPSKIAKCDQKTLTCVCIDKHEKNKSNIHSSTNANPNISRPFTP